MTESKDDLAEAIKATDTWPYNPRHCENGHDELWNWFGLSYASWITIPRVLAHHMPDEWQRKMAALLFEYDDTYQQLFQHVDCDHVVVMAKKNGKYTKHPDWLLNYRHPKHELLDQMMKGKQNGPD